MHDVNHMKGLLKEARKVSSVLARLKEIKAVGIGGSVALGYADEYTTDFDLVAFCTRIPDVRKRRKLLSKVVDKWHPEYEHFRNIDVFDLRGLRLCSVFYHELRVFRYFINEFEKGRMFPQLVNHVIYVKPLYDPDKVLRSWKTKFRKYPDFLRKGEVQCIFPLLRFVRESVEKELKRGNLNFLYFKASQLRATLDRIVYALNRRYWFEGSLKWAFRDYESFRILPRDYLARIDRLNRARSIREKFKVIEELGNDLLEIVRKEGLWDRSCGSLKFVCTLNHLQVLSAWQARPGTNHISTPSG